MAYGSGFWKVRARYRPQFKSDTSADARMRHQINETIIFVFGTCKMCETARLLQLCEIRLCFALGRTSRNNNRSSASIASKRKAHVPSPCSYDLPRALVSHARCAEPAACIPLPAKTTEKTVSTGPRAFLSSFFLFFFFRFPFSFLIFNLLFNLQSSF